MFSLFLIWFISFIIILFLEINLSLMFYDRFVSDTFYDKRYTFIYEKYNSILGINYSLYLVFTKIILCAFIGYLIESKFNISKILYKNLEEKQYIFFKTVKYQYRIFLPIIIFELPIVALFLVVNLNTKNLVINNLFILSIGILLGQFIKIYSIHKNIIEMDIPEGENNSIIRNISNDLLSEKTSLNMGQIYSKLILPYFFFILPFLMPLFIKEIFYIIPNYDLDRISIIVFISFITILIRYIYIDDNFYFSSINIYNLLFVLIKYIICVSSIILCIYFNLNIYLFLSIIVLSSFTIPYHPYRLR